MMAVACRGLCGTRGRNGLDALNDLMEAKVPVGTKVAGILSVSSKKSGDPLDVGTSSSNS
jgi:hypothetical protein